LLPPPPRAPLFPYTTLFRSIVYAALLVLQLIRRRTFAAGVAATVGSFAFLIGASVLFALGGVSSRPGERLADLNEVLGIGVVLRSEEHTSELQSRENLVCRL